MSTTASVRDIGLGVWLAEAGADSLRFFGPGAEERAGKYAAALRSGAHSELAPRGKCSRGVPCDRDRLHAAFLRDVTDAELGRVTLCAEHLEEARPTPGKPPRSPAPAAPPPGGSAAAGPAMGRRRKRPGPPAGGAS